MESLDQETIVYMESLDEIPLVLFSDLALFGDARLSMIISLSLFIYIIYSLRKFIHVIDSTAALFGIFLFFLWFEGFVPEWLSENMPDSVESFIDVLIVYLIVEWMKSKA